MVSLTARDASGNVPLTHVDGYHYTFTMGNSDVTVTLTCAENPRITYQSNPADSVTFTGPSSADPNSVVNFVVNPATYYDYPATVSIKDSDGANITYSETSDHEYSFTIGEKDVTVTVTPTKTWSLITYSVEPDYASGEVNAPTTGAPPGTTIRLSAVPTSGRHLVSITAIEQGGNPLTVTNEGENWYSFVLGDKDVAVTVTFANNRHNVYISSNGNGTGYANGSASVLTDVEYGTHVTLTGTPNAGYRYLGCEIINGIPLSVDSDGGGFIMGDSDMQLAAVFEREYTISYVVEQGQGSCNLSQTVGIAGDTISFGPQPAAGYELDYFTIDGTTDYSAAVFTVEDSDVVIHLYFKLKTFGVTLSYNSDECNVSCDIMEGNMGDVVTCRIEPLMGGNLIITVEGTTNYTIEENVDDRIVKATFQNADIIIAVNLG